MKKQNVLLNVRQQLCNLVLFSTTKFREENEFHHWLKRKKQKRKNQFETVNQFTEDIFKKSSIC